MSVAEHEGSVALRVSFRVPRKAYEQMRAEAALQDRSLSALVRREFLKTWEREHA